MSNGLYDFGRQGFLDGSIDWDTDTIKIRLLAAGYVVDLSTHEFLSDVTGSTTVGTDQTLGTKTVAAGVAGAANALFPTLSGSVVTMMICYKDTGVAGTSRLIHYWDTGAGFPYTPNGSNLSIAWDTGANKIFKL